MRFLTRRHPYRRVDDGVDEPVVERLLGEPAAIEERPHRRGDHVGGGALCLHLTALPGAVDHGAIKPLCHSLCIAATSASRSAVSMIDGYTALQFAVRN